MMVMMFFFGDDEVLVQVIHFISNPTKAKFEQTIRAVVATPVHTKGHIGKPIHTAIVAHPSMYHFLDRTDLMIFSLPNRVIFRHIATHSSAGIILR